MRTEKVKPLHGMGMASKSKELVYERKRGGEKNPGILIKPGDEGKWKEKCSSRIEKHKPISFWSASRSTATNLQGFGDTARKPVLKTWIVNPCFLWQNEADRQKRLWNVTDPRLNSWIIPFILENTGHFQENKTHSVKGILDRPRAGGQVRKKRPVQHLREVTDKAFIILSL